MINLEKSNEETNALSDAVERIEKSDVEKSDWMSGWRSRGKSERGSL